MKVIRLLLLIPIFALAWCAWAMPIGVAERVAPPQPNEIFDPRLSGVVTLQGARAAIDRMAPAGGFASQRQTAGAIESFLRNRFYHGYSNYTFSENPLLWLIGFVDPRTSAVIDPNDIMKFRYAACSQQALVFQFLLKSYGIHFASLGTTKVEHFTSISKLDGHWYYTDSWDHIGRSHFGPIRFSDLVKGRARDNFYGAPAAKYLKVLEAGEYHIISQDAFPAPRGWALQTFTRFVYLLSPLIFFALLLSTNTQIVRAAFRRVPATKDSDGDTTRGRVESLA